MSLVQSQGNTLLISGSMTMDSVDDLLRESQSLITAGNLEIDLSGVPEVDSAGVSILFEWLRLANSRNANLVFVNLPDTLLNLATLYGVVDLIPRHTH
jgi:phospholipid transport system transporter-binding protein